MNVNLTGHGIELTEGLRNRVEEKFSKLDRHSDNITAAHVVLSVEGKRQTVEITLQIAKAKDLHAASTGDDMYAMIDDLAKKIERMLVRQKDKALDSERRVDKEARFEGATEEI